MQKAEGKDTFKTVLKELLQKRDEVNTANEKVTRLETALSVKEEMQANHERAMEKAQLRHKNAMQEERSMQENDGAKSRREVDARENVRQDDGANRTSHIWNKGSGRWAGGG